VIAGKVVNDAHAAIREGQILSRMSGHAGIPQYHGVWGTGAQRTVVMDWAEGGSPHTWKSRTLDKSARIVSRLLTHLEAVHQRGYLHQDVKPDNTRINDRDESSSLALLDFGQAIEHGRHWNGQSGTPEFRAPEQDHSGVRTQATDVYGAASYFLYLMQGKYPFERARALHKAQDWNGLAAHRADRDAVKAVTDPGLRSILWKAMSPNPAERYQTAAEFRHALLPYTKAN
jgi:serine/threonine protein kinase